ncbi:MAG TPA: hypothetical protein VJU84_02200 [Pyrinomonadaceae bacterium]|nr:hypothetical protein [Pyrinomonadaceae bacterium]
MDIKVDLSGFDELEKSLDKLQKNLEKIDGEHEVTGEELLTDDFIRAHTNFQTRKAFLDASGIKSQEEIGTEAFDNFVALTTHFDNWEEMFKAAGTDWARRQLEL